MASCSIKKATTWETGAPRSLDVYFCIDAGSFERIRSTRDVASLFFPGPVVPYPRFCLGRCIFLSIMRVLWSSLPPKKRFAGHERTGCDRRQRAISTTAASATTMGRVSMAVERYLVVSSSVFNYGGRMLQL